MSQFLGKYRGKVVNNSDPLRLGRIIALVPAVSELPLSWAMPCVPYAGAQEGFFAVPAIGANVWIEFEGGDPNFPIWTGGFWGNGETPGAADPSRTVWQLGTLSIVLDRTQGTITAQQGPGSEAARIMMSADGIVLSAGSLTVTIEPDGMAVNGTVTRGEFGLRDISLSTGPNAVTIKPSGIALSTPGAHVHVDGDSVTVHPAP